METKTVMISGAVPLDEASLQEIKGGITDTFQHADFKKDNSNSNSNTIQGCSCNCHC